MKKVLILGGTGHLGAALRSRLCEFSVGFSHHHRPAEGSFHFDLSATARLPDADVVIGAFPLAKSVEGLLSGEVEELVRRHVQRCGGATIIQLSTDAVYSGLEGLRRERDAPDGASAYGRAQCAVDDALLKHAPDCLVVRTSFIFGKAAGRFDKRLAPLLSNPVRVPKQTWAANVFRSPTEVNFLAEGIARSIDRNVTGVLNIAGPRMSIAEFFAAALAPLGLFDLPRAVEEADPAIARDTSLHTGRMSELIDLSAVEAWEWYQRSIR